MKNNRYKVAEITINYKPNKHLAEWPKITCSIDSYTHFKLIWSDKIDYVEEAYMLLLNRANKLIGHYKLSQGGTAGTVVDAKMIFQAALKANAQAIILAHNHPSGSLKPSEVDQSLTKKLVEAGKVLDLPLLDHLVITSEGYFSFADESML